MTTNVRPLVAGNWKMHGTAASLAEAKALAQALAKEPARARVALCPPATLLERMARALEGSPVELGAQDCHDAVCGAYTGDLGADMLVDAGATLVILGHSERRAAYKEDDARIAAKATTALAAGLEPIVCVGETLEERRAGRAVEVVRAQIFGSLPDVPKGRAFCVAYEPVWAIGTGMTPTTDEIAEVHAAARAAILERLGDGGRAAPILYGGSVKPGNAAEILAVPEVGGALVGGASLKAADFLPIVRAA
jgi:triosephosphate isomerase